MTKTGTQAKTSISRATGKDRRREQRVKNELIQEEIREENTLARARKRPRAEKRGGRTP